MNSVLLTLAADAHHAHAAPAPIMLLPTSFEPLAWILTLALGGLALAMVLATARVVVGPSVPDRVVALDVIANLCVAAIAVFSIATQRAGLIMVALVVALILFLGTTAFSLYLERRAKLTTTGVTV